MLVVVTLLWGLSFPLMKTWQEAARGCPAGVAAAAFTFIAVRMAWALAALAVFLPRLYVMPTRRECAVGALLGCIFFLGFALQVLGLTWTTPAMSAFITSLGSAWVPLLAWLWFGIRLRGAVLVGMSLGVGGTIILGMTDLNGGGLGVGEALTVLASWVFAAEILLLDRLGRTVQSAHLTVPFVGTTGVLAAALAVACAGSSAGIPAWWAWTASMLEHWDVLRAMLLLAFFSTVLAFHWMNVYQPRVSATRAALVYLLEPVFGTAFSICLGRDVLTWWLALGGGLILAGNLVVELPGLLRRADSEEP
jgi:drug/metabolite transporter (DMT)-like permease